MDAGDTEHKYRAIFLGQMKMNTQETESKFGCPFRVSWLTWALSYILSMEKSGLISI